ncbi:MAG TPA: hypothetical protein VF092_02340 [Longimicrobium sp.]
MRPSRIIAAVFIAAACGLAPRAVAAQNEWAVKVVCGRGEPFTVPATVATTVNIHNSLRENTRFVFKVAQAGPIGSGSGGPVTGFQAQAIGPDRVIAITCREITRIAGVTSLDGFLVIQSASDLDVVAVYSAAAPGGSISTMDVERVTPRRIQ